MALFLIGFALVLFDLNIAVGSASIGVFPDMIGYALMRIAGYEVVGLFREADSSANGAAGKKVFSCWRLSVIFGALAFFGVFSPASAILLGGMSFVTDAYLIVTCFKTAAAQGPIAY